MRALAFGLLSLIGLASSASADALPPAGCPHSVPVTGTACAPPGFAACTYTSGGHTTLCSCRDRVWSCVPMPSAADS